MTDPVSETGTDLSDRRHRLLEKLSAQARHDWSDFPASYAQRRQWVLHQLAPTSSAYHMPIAFRLTGPFDVAALRGAVDALVERHEALRTTFPAPAGQPVQRVHSTGRLPVEVRDLTLGTVGVLDEVAAAARVPFDLAQGPLARVTVWPLGADEHVLLLVAHHIIADGWSVEILWRDLACSYREHRHGGTGAMPVLPIQPADYATWEAAEVKGGHLDEHLAYWRAELNPPAPPLDLPTERARPQGLTGPAGTVRTTLDAQLTASVAAFARDRRTTEFVVLLAAFAATVGRYTGQADMVIGSPVPGRLRPETADLVGCFVNTVPLRLRWDADGPAQALLDHVRAKATAAQQHQAVPLDLLVGQLAASRGATANPVFSVVFTVAEQARPELLLDGVAVAPVDLAPAEAKFDLTCVVGRLGSELSVQWDYRRDLLDGATMAALADTYTRGLRALLTDPGRALSAPDEGATTLMVDPPIASLDGLTLGELFARQAAAVPDKVAVWDGESGLTYRGLERRANMLAHSLRAAGVGPEVGVGVCLPRSADLAVACLAVVKAGGCYVPLDPAYPRERLAFMVSDSGLHHVITRPELADRVPGPRQTLLVNGQPVGTTALPDTAPDAAVHPGNLCLSIYTSGSTGRPKAVGITHRGVVDLALPGTYCGFGRDETVLWISSVSFDVATWEIWGTLLHGATGVISAERAYTARDIKQVISGRGVTIALFTPALFNALVDEDVTTFAGLRRLLVGGEALSPVHIHTAQSALPDTQLMNAYGPAEITTLASCHEVDRTDSPLWTVPIGTPVSGTTLSVVDDRGRPVPPGAVGELWLTGSGLARGYLGHPALTAQRFVPGPGGTRWYRTGDVVRRLGTGALIYRGRADGQVKVRGHRVEPGEVRAVLLEQPSVARAAVVPHIVGPADCRLVAYVVPSGAGDIGRLREDLRRVLPEYLVPAHVTVVDHLPTTPNGKVDVAALAPPDLGAPLRAAAGRVHTPDEAALARLWAEVLGRDEATIGPADDFFALGGHSLLAAMLVARLRDRLGVDVPLVDLFDRPVLEQQAAHIGRLRDAGSAAAVAYPTVPRPGPLSPAQQRLWFLTLMDPDSAVYNIPLVARIRGELDIAALRRAIAWLVARHEVLRSVIIETDDGYRQHAVPVQDIPGLAIVDVTAADDPAQAAADAVTETTGRPFRLVDGEPPIRSVLVRQGIDDFVVCLVVHHIAADAWSAGIIADELGQAYAAFRSGSEPDLPPQSAQFVDVVAQQASDARLAEGAAFWREALAGVPHQLRLPARRAVPGAQGGPAVRLALDPGTVADVHRVASNAGCTDYVVLLAAFATVLAGYCDQSEFLVGTPVANRPDPVSERLVGFFANTVVMRVDTGGDPTVGELVERVRNASLAALAHQDFPFERLVEELAPQRDLERSPLFQVMFAYDNTPRPQVALAGVDVTVMPVANPVSRFDLTLALSHRDGGIDGFCEFNPARFAEADVRWLLDQVQRTVQVFADELEGAGRRLSEVGVLAPPPPTLEGGDEIEETVTAVWRELLRYEGFIDPTASFFALGGHSFLAARAATRLSRALGVAITPRALFEHQSIASLAAWLRDQTGPHPAPEIPRLDPSVTRAPLTYAQERLWFLAQFSPASAAYNLPLTARVTGTLDVSALRRAVSYVVARHESLRTRYAHRDGSAMQRVLDVDDATPEVTEADLTGRPDSDRAGRELLADEAFRPFDLAGGELPLRTHVVAIDENEHLVMLTVHHIAADGWAVGVLVQDLCAAYAAYHEDREPALAPPALRYLDVAAWQRSRLDSASDGLAFWGTALADAPDVLDLPSSRPRPPQRQHRGESVGFDLGPDLTAGVRRLARAADCTDFMVLAAAFATVLSHYSGQGELLIGTPVANRDDPALESLVGLLANTVVLRADLRGDPTVAQLLARTRSTCLDAFAHQDVPFERVVEKLAPARDASRTPLFQVMLALNNAPMPELTLPGVTCSPLEPENPTTKFDIVLNLSDQHAGGRTVAGVCEYDVDVYDHSMISALLSHLRRVLTAFVTDVDQRLSRIDLLEKPQRQSLVVDFNRVDADYDYRSCLHRLVEEVVERTPEAIAVVAADTTLTYRELDRAANVLAHGLVDAGVAPDDVVGVCAPRSPQLVVGEYAVLKAGAAILPLDPAWPAARLATVIADAGCRVVLTGSDGGSALPTTIRTIALGIDGHAASGSVRPDVAVGPGNRAYVIYTSGSTGQPKGAEIEHGAICNNLLWMQADWPLTGADRMLHKTATTFDVAVKEVFWPLLAGARLVLAEPGTERDPQALLDQVSAHGITITHFVPSMLDLALAAAERRGEPLGSALRYVMCGAETLPVSTQERFFAATRADLLHMYGPTETAIAVTGWTCRRDAGTVTRVPLGRPMPNSSLFVLDQHLRPVPPLVWGELYVGGAPLGRGYLNRPAATAAAFVPDPFAPVPGARLYRTGDLVRHGPDGLLEFRGRVDSQVKVRGFRIDLGEVEAVLRTHPSVNSAATVVIGAGQPDAHLVAFVILDATRTPLTETDLRRHLHNQLPAHQVPADIVVLDRLPLNRNGKVDRSALAAMPRSPGRREGVYVAPRDDIERTIAEVWAEVLGVDPVGVEDDFFALGGHSLQAASVVARLSERFGRELPLRDLFADPTVATLARLVRDARPDRALRPMARRARPESAS